MSGAAPQPTLIDRHDQRQREMLNDLLREVYGFDLSRWEAWDDRYRCYAISDGDRVIANVSVALMTLLIDGRSVPAAQIGAVATRQEYRGQGLARQVIEYALSQHADRAALLFAHSGVADFYPRFGFRHVAQGRPLVTLAAPTTGANAECPRLGPDSPDIIRRLRGPRQRSAVLDVTDVDHINRFHLTIRFADDIHLVPSLDAVVVARQRDDALFIHDVIAGRPVTLADLLPRLPFSGVTTVEFGFMPDWLGVDYELRPDDPAVSDSYLFVRGFDMAPNLRFPSLAMT